MLRWIKCLYIKHLKYSFPIDCFQMFQTYDGEIYIHQTSYKPTIYSIQYGIHLIHKKLS